MGIEENKDVVLRMVDQCVNAHRADLLGRFVHADLRVHPGTPGSAPDTEGLAELREAFVRFRTTFPDLHVSIEQLVAEDDLVSSRWTGTGTHAGPLAGIDPTGITVRWGGTDTYRIADGRIAEWWRNDDSVGLLHQIGCELRPAGS